ncbi:MAG: DUF3488 and transglutaminase-like domain-containing protein, partial [Gammaproteobacteria bacterium]|nr:DUF3488 and transglutaminase-like domain-containing protein [Gammaproteobacteria bacterium]
YWRALVLTRFNGRSWSGSEMIIGDPAEKQIAVRGEPVRYQVTMEPTMQQWVFAMDMPMRWSLDRAFMGRQQQLARVTPIEQRLAYDVESYIDFTIQADLPQTFRYWYAKVPEDSNRDSRALAVRMREQAGSDTAYIDAVLAKFHTEEFFYTLEPPELGANPVDKFLFDTRRGFCEHYASAFAFMMRAAGIPSRVVLGYQGGEVNPMGGHLIVRQSDAHAWTEVWLEQYGWYRVDPTSAVAPERIEYDTNDAALAALGEAWGFSATSKMLHQLTLTWDAVNAKWNEWVLGYGPDNQNRFMRWLGMNDPNWRNMLLAMIAVVVGLVVIVSVLLMLRYRPPKKDEAQVLFDRWVKRTGVEQQTGETAWRFARRVEEMGSVAGEQVHTVTNAYHDARYGEQGATALQRLREAVNATP